MRKRLRERPNPDKRFPTFSMRGKRKSRFPSLSSQRPIYRNFRYGESSKTRKELQNFKAESFGVLLATRAFSPDQYSRVFVIPGMGCGYLPSLPATRGAGEFMVNWSTPGANSWSLLRRS